MLNNWYRNFGKRLFDLILVISALVLLSPVLILLALVVRLKLGGPVLFRQLRPGQHGQPFIIFKFRTMANRFDSEGNLLPDKDRLTKFGRFLRAASLDELPELINVLKGEMSLIGPRPLMMCYLNRYNVEQMRRHEVKQGLTGWAQVNGRNALSWEDRLKLDTWYVDNISFALDLKILLMTVWIVLKREGISQPGHATMEEFIGSTQNGELTLSLPASQNKTNTLGAQTNHAPKETRSVSPELKARLVIDLISNIKKVEEICHEFKLNPQLLAQWQGDFLQNAGMAFQDEDNIIGKLDCTDLEKVNSQKPLEIRVEAPEAKETTVSG